jgi:hypothetical protein
MEINISLEEVPAALYSDVMVYLGNHNHARLLGCASFETRKGERIRYTAFIEWGNIMTVFIQSTMNLNQVESYNMIIKDMKSAINMKKAAI